MVTKCFYPSDKKFWILNLLRQTTADSKDKEHLIVATICRGILLNEMIRLLTFDCTGILNHWCLLSVAGNILAKFSDSITILI